MSSKERHSMLSFIYSDELTLEILIVLFMNFSTHSAYNGNSSFGFNLTRSCVSGSFRDRVNSFSTRSLSKNLDINLY
jgi:hypothetical protein